MHLSFDWRHNIAYLRFGEGRQELDTICIGDDLCLDLAPDGSVYGIELLDAKRQLGEQGVAELVLTNQATGVTLELSLPVEDGE